jgi:hypothetical protein
MIYFLSVMRVILQDQLMDFRPLMEVNNDHEFEIMERFFGYIDLVKLIAKKINALA